MARLLEANTEATGNERVLTEAFVPGRVGYDQRLVRQDCVRTLGSGGQTPPPAVCPERSNSAAPQPLVFVFRDRGDPHVRSTRPRVGPVYLPYQDCTM